jgi:hypothetical protein
VASAIAAASARIAVGGSLTYRDALPILQENPCPT